MKLTKLKAVLAAALVMATGFAAWAESTPVETEIGKDGPKTFWLGPKGEPGSETNPWEVGEGVEAWTNGTELVIGGEGTVTDLSELPAEVKDGIEALTVADPAVTGAADGAFTGMEDIALTLPDGWQGALPDEGGSWYGATGVTLTAMPLTVKNVTFQQRYPWNGLVDVTCDLTGSGTVTLGATVLTNGVEFVAKLSLEGVLVIDLDAAGGETNGVKFIWNAAKDLPVGFKQSGVTFKVTAEMEDVPPPDAVQLWENGPYFATCNVGATKPEDYGYYFWWGDTVGYKHDGTKWVSVDGSGTTIKFSGTDETVSKTYDKSNQELKDLGFSDDASSGVLNAANDAATAHLGAPWRMMTKAELDCLVANCEVEWTDNWNETGIKGTIVKGKGDYSANSIFFPAAGCGYESSLNDAGLLGFYWSSAPNSDDSIRAWGPSFNSDEFCWSDYYRYYGQSVRAVRDAASASAPAIAAKSAAGALDLTVGDRVAKDAETIVVDPAWGNASEATASIEGESSPRTYTSATVDTWDTTALEPGRYGMTFVAGEVCYSAAFWKTGNDWVVLDGSELTENMVFKAGKTYLVLGTNMVNSKTLMVEDGAKFFYDEGAPAGFKAASVAELPKRYKIADGVDSANEDNLFQIVEKPRGSEDNPWDVGDGATAYTNGTELVIGGKGTISDLSEIPTEIKADITAINVASNGVAGVASDAFQGVGDGEISLTLTDGWQGELPNEGGNWYGATGVTLTAYPLAVKNVQTATHWPWDGKIDITCDLTGSGEVDLSVALTTNGVTVYKATTLVGETTIDLVEGTVTNGVKLVWSAQTDIADANFNASDVRVAVTVTRAAEPIAVQLWEGGPYWAKCNVGATKPEECGYYFWWGDTVGYTNKGSVWISVLDSTKIRFYSNHTLANGTYNKDEATLKSGNWIDDKGNLTATHDAAAKYLDSPWRMPTDAEMQGLTDESKVSFEWTTKNGVDGCLLTGVTAGYTGRSIFLPAAGYGFGDDFRVSGEYGYYWSSTPKLDTDGSNYYAWSIAFNSDGSSRNNTIRSNGLAVRPVRDTALSAPDGGDGFAAVSEAFAFDLRTEVALAEGEVTIADVSYNDTYTGVVAQAGVTLGYVNTTTKAQAELMTGLSGAGVTNVTLPTKDGAYMLTHVADGRRLISFVTFTVSGYPLGSETNPWEVGAGDDPMSVTAYTNDTGTVFFDPVRGTVTKAGLETVTNALGGANFPAKLIAADGSETNDLVMVLGESGTAYDTIAEAIAADETSYTLFEVSGYWVSYDGNGAAGTMATDMFIPTIPTNLTANAFSAVGYAFAGWLTNGVDEVAYADQAAGVNFAEPGETLALKAKWTEIPGGVKAATYVDLTNLIEQVSLPVAITLDEDVALQPGDKVVIPAGKDVTFAGEGKFDVSATIPALWNEVVVGEGFADDSALAFFKTDKDAKAYFEDGNVVLSGRGESADFPWILGPEGVETNTVMWLIDGAALVKPVRGTVSVEALASVTNAMGGYVPAAGELQVVSADGTATNDVVMLLADDRRAFSSLAEVFAAVPQPTTVQLFEEPMRTVAIPAATAGYAYVVSNVTAGAVMTGDLVSGTNSYKVVDGEVVKVYFTLTDGYRYVGEVPSAMDLGAITGDRTVTAGALPTAVGLMGVAAYPAAKAYDGEPTNVTWAVTNYLGEAITDATVYLREQGAAAWVAAADFADYLNVTDATVEVKAEKSGFTTATNAATVTILPRAVTLTSGTETWIYDGEAHSNTTVEVTLTGGAAGVRALPEGEGITAGGFPTIAEVGSVPNAFTYAFAEGTEGANYNVTCVTGTLAVTGYWVSYDGNGAAGEMAADLFVPGVTTNLTANAFSAVGYTFAGWTVNGTDVIYTDGAAGVDFAQAGETLALQAKWTVDPAGVKPADYDALTNAIAQATLPMTITLDEDIVLQPGDKVVIPAGKDVTFAGTGKFDVSGIVPQFGEPVVVGEGFADDDALDLFDADGVSKPVFEDGAVGLVARGEAADFPWELDEAKGVTAWVDEALTNLAGVVIDNGMPTATNAIDLAALTSNFATYGYEPAATPFNALLAVGKDGGAPEYVKPVNWIGAAGKYATLEAALAAGETAVVPNFETKEAEIPQEIVETGMGDDGETYTAVVENKPAENVAEPVKVVRAEGLVDVATNLEKNVRLVVEAKEVADVAPEAANALSKKLEEVSFGGKGFESVAFVDLSVFFNGEKQTGCELGSPITLHIPWPVVAGGDYGVVRIHNGVAQTIPQGEENAVDGEFFTVDAEAGEIVLRVNKFSDYAVGSTPAVEVTLPAALPGVTYVVSNLTANAEVEMVGGGGVAGGAVYLLPIGAKVSVTAVAKNGYSLKPGAVAAVIDSVPADAAAVQALIDNARVGWEVVPCDFLLYPDGDGAFRPAEKTTTYYGAVVGEDGVAGTIVFRMTKPNRRTGQFSLSATVKTLVDKRRYSFKAKKVTEADAVTNVNGVLTFALEGTNRKSREHTLAVTLGGDSLTGAFDGFVIDGARHVFSTSRDPKREAVKPFVGTWTGAFAEPGDTNGVSVTAFSAKLTKSGSASVKVYFADGKIASCSAKAEVGADGVVAVPATVWRSVKGAYRSFGFRLVFGTDADGNAVCEAADLAPVRDWTKKTGETVVIEDLEFLAAGLQTVTAKDFKAYAVAVDPALTEALGPITKSTLRLSTSTGRITGTFKWKVVYVDARGREKTKTVSGKATGIVVNGVGIGTVTVKQDGVTSAFAFAVHQSCAAS